LSQLVTRHHFEHRLAAQQPPEIRRVGLETLVMKVKVLWPRLTGDAAAKAATVLRRAIEAPSLKAVSSAISSLQAREWGGHEGAAGNWVEMSGALLGGQVGHHWADKSSCLGCHRWSMWPRVSGTHVPAAFSMPAAT